MSVPILVSVRQPFTNAGGPVVPAREEQGHLDGQGRVVILVHGYNNSRVEDLRSYGEFLDDLTKKFNTETAPFVEFLWPGDEPNKIVSALSYPNQIRPAID